jgi:phenylpropionate dioxygenase-like ring-hydroxylating dioxygenase large terminal subunit
MRARPEARVKSASGELERIVGAALADASPNPAAFRTLPPAAFTSKAFYDLEVEKIFKKDWLCVGHVSQVANVGDYFTLDMFGELLVIVRTKDRVRTFSRVCLHRWAPIVEGEGNAKAFSCPIHGWTYALDGQLMNAPFMAEAADFDPKACRLPELRTEIVDALGLIFITFSDTADAIGELLEDLPEQLANFRLSELVAVLPQATEAPFNWKILLATGMEAYHHFVAHPTTFERTHPTRLTWCEEGRKAWALCHSGAPVDTPLTKELPLFPGLRDAEKRFLDLYHIYPLTRLVVYPDTVRFRVIMPDGPACTRTKAVYLVRPEVAEKTELMKAAFAEAQKSSDVSGKEDYNISVLQQRGAGSSLAAAGRLSPLEASLGQFAEYVRARIAAN